MDEKKYALSLENIMDFVFQTNVAPSTYTEITETYAPSEGDKLALIEKQLKEEKDGGDKEQMSLRYDLVKSLIDNLMGISAVRLNDEQPSGAFSFGEALIINTLVNENLIVEIQ